MFPTAIVRMRYSPAKNMTTQTPRLTRSHAPSRQENDSPDAQQGFFENSTGFFRSHDDDLDDVFVGRNSFALHVERMARDRNTVENNHDSREVEAGMKNEHAKQQLTPVHRDERNTPMMIDSVSTDTTHSSITFTATLRTIPEADLHIKDSNLAPKSDKRATSPVAFVLSRPLSVEESVELAREEKEQEKKVPEVHVLSQLPSSPPRPVETNSPQSTKTGEDEIRLFNQLGSTAPSVRSPVKETEAHLLRQLGTSSFVLQSPPPASPIKVGSSGLRTPRGSDVGITPRRKTSEGSSDSETRRRLPERRPKTVSPWQFILANKRYYLFVAVCWIVLSEVFTLWWQLVSQYSSQETMERDLREIGFWFAFCSALVLFFTAFQPRPLTA